MSAPTLELDAVPELLSARTALHQHRLDEAINYYQSAVQAHPRNLRVRIEFATTLGQSFQTDEALNHLAHAAEIAGHDPNVASELAKAYSRLYRVDLAMAALETISEEKRTAPIRTALAVHLEMLGQFADAEVQLRIAVEDAPNQPEPMLVLARVLGHLGRHQESLDTARNTLAQTPNNAMVALVRGHYQVAEMSDRLGDYDQALHAAEQAKAIQRSMPHSQAAAKAFVNRLNQLETSYQRLDADVIRRWLGEKNPKPLPNNVVPVHLLGAPRSGTTLLEQALAVHPELCVSSERHVFSGSILPQMFRSQHPGIDGLSTVDQLSTDTLGMLRASYVQFMSATHPSGAIQGVHLDKKPANMLAIFALLRLLPESRFIIAIRDPRDIVVSQYMRFFPITDMSSMFLDWRDTARAYARLMSIWIKLRNLLDEATWLEIRYEDSCDDIIASANRVIRFVGLTPHEQVARYLKVAEKTYVHSPTFAEVRQPVHRNRLERWRNYEQQINPLLDVLRPVMDALDYH